MTEVYLQYWEESERAWGVRPDGCSLHITEENHRNYVKSIYSNRDENNVPDEYDRIVGGLITIDVSDELYQDIIKNGHVRLSQVSLKNLRNLQSIMMKDESIQ